MKPTYPRNNKKRRGGKKIEKRGDKGPKSRGEGVSAIRGAPFFKGLSKAVFRSLGIFFEGEGEKREP